MLLNLITSSVIGFTVALIAYLVTGKQHI